jgi:hypothetical protein
MPCVHVQEYDIVGAGQNTTLAVLGYVANLATALRREAEVQELRTGNRFSVEDGVSDGEDDLGSDDESGATPVAKKRTKSKVQPTADVAVTGYGQTFSYLENTLVREVRE